jgi:glycosyltransferase involved in cell wall biosynthesis
MSSHDTKPLVSIAIPAYNESENIAELARRLRTVFEELAEEFDFEVVICENGSSDSTEAKILAEVERDPRFRMVQLSRNFYMEGGMMAALSKVRGDACVIMSADLQDPPEMIPQMVRLWADGVDHVYTVITYRHGESRFRRTAAEIFYWLIDKVSDTPVPRNASDFRLVDRQMYEAFNALPEKNRMVRATWGWLGFRATSLQYERPARAGGKSTFNPIATAGFAVRGILASSLSPLKLMPILGGLFSFLSFCGAIGIAIRALFFGVPFPGWGTLACLTLLLFGFLFLGLGIVAEYVGMIFVEARSRPPFIERIRDARPSRQTRP